MMPWSLLQIFGPLQYLRWLSFAMFGRSASSLYEPAMDSYELASQRAYSPCSSSPSWLDCQSTSVAIGFYLCSLAVSQSCLGAQMSSQTRTNLGSLVNSRASDRHCPCLIAWGELAGSVLGLPSWWRFVFCCLKAYLACLKYLTIIKDELGFACA